MTFHLVQEMESTDESLTFQRQKVMTTFHLPGSPARQVTNFLSTLLDFRDAHSSGHGQNVNLLATALAQRLDYTAERLALLQFAADIHDIGKITIADAVASKPGRLTKAEYGMIKQHAEFGYELLKPLHLPPGITEPVHYHHEDWNGCGYPAGLKGLEIPQGARVLRIADFFDALTTERGYRHRYTFTKALDVMTQNAEKLDPEMFEQFLKLPHAKILNGG